MTAVEHIIAWIESSQPHYNRLLQLERLRKGSPPQHPVIAEIALGIAIDAYREATRGGDMFPVDQSPATLLDAAKALLKWEMEQ